jgi:hypothetical protein
MQHFYCSVKQKENQAIVHHSKHMPQSCPQSKHQELRVCPGNIPGWNCICDGAQYNQPLCNGWLQQCQNHVLQTASNTSLEQAPMQALAYHLGIA